MYEFLVCYKYVLKTDEGISYRCYENYSSRVLTNTSATVTRSTLLNWIDIISSEYFLKSNENISVKILTFNRLF